MSMLTKEQQEKLMDLIDGYSSASFDEGYMLGRDMSDEQESEDYANESSYIYSQLLGYLEELNIIEFNDDIEVITDDE